MNPGEPEDDVRGVRSALAQSAIFFFFFLYTTSKSEQYATSTFHIMHLICPTQFCISIVFNFSLDGCNAAQEK